MDKRRSITIIIGDAPYGTERAFSALRFVLAALLQELNVNIFLIENGVYTGMNKQAPADYPSDSNLLIDAIGKGAVVKACMPCCKARGITLDDLVDGIQMGTINDLVGFVVNSDRTIFF
ncbi:MAG: DsrE/DsrF-like family protein [Methanocella sp. PtaU1.Bin125]|nr:MAG: DsrE/DsrF-like family protein [Methanocella sp. PtaU1.Bin125]